MITTTITNGKITPRTYSPNLNPYPNLNSKPTLTTTLTLRKHCKQNLKKGKIDEMKVCQTIKECLSME